MGFSSRVSFKVLEEVYLYISNGWQGEEDKGEKMERFVVQLAGVADVFVNDAFGSWQPHASTYYITKYLPSYAGLCMQVCRYYLQFFSICLV